MWFETVENCAIIKKWMILVLNFRKLGISLANDVCKKYRREGKYFDELIK